jgi:hypothetical protein
VNLNLNNLSRTSWKSKERGKTNGIPAKKHGIDKASKPMHTAPDLDSRTWVTGSCKRSRRNLKQLKEQNPRDG